MALALRAIRATQWLRLSLAGRVAFATAWLLSLVVLLICATTDANVWDGCAGGNDSGFDFSFVIILGAFVALLVAVVLSFWRASIWKQRLAVAGFGLLTVGVIAGAAWAMSAHPNFSCPACCGP